MKNNYMAQLNKIKCPSELMTTPISTLKELFKETDKTENSSDLFTVRGWIMEALEENMSEDNFDSWLDEQ